MGMEGAVQRWAINLSAWDPNVVEFDFFLSILPAHEQCAVIRFLNFEDKKRALISRLMQRMLIHSVLNIAYDEIIIERTLEGKPYLAVYPLECEFPNFNFNVAHHGDFVVIASEALCLIGVDIMGHTAPLMQDFAGYIRNFWSYFTPLEWNCIVNANSPSNCLHQFYRFWCLKEAYVKAIGIGLGFEDLKHLEFHFPQDYVWGNSACLRVNGVEREDWSFFLHELDNKHWACTSRGPPWEAMGDFKRTLHQTEFNLEIYSASLQLPNKPFQMLKPENLVPDIKR